MDKYKDKVQQQVYLKGFKDGFYSALKIAWAEAELLYIRVPNVAKDYVMEFINKIKS